MTKFKCISLRDKVVVICFFFNLSCDGGGDCVSYHVVTIFHHKMVVMTECVFYTASNLYGIPT